KLYKYNERVLEISDLVEKYYIGDIDKQTMIDGLAYGYVAGLEDRYADYLTVDEAKENSNSLMGYNTGIGIQASLHPTSYNIYVSEVHKGSPAETAGLKKGDEIVSIDDKIVKELGYSAVINYIPTIPIGQKIAVSVLRSGVSLNFEITLSQFASQSVFYEQIGNLGYINITTFNERTVEQFKFAIDSLIKQDVKGLIFDVRGNLGGTLNSVCQMVDYLVPKGLITKVDYKVDALDESFMSDEHEINLPMAVLTDKNSASASELFTQSLLDYKKAVTVGAKTYGKGVVQSTYTLSDGSQVRFTVAKYYTQSGTCVDGIGISPTIPTEWTDDELTYRIVNGIRLDKDYLAAQEYINNQLS
ncbi:MAG: PDZ domain-containing protein, partial [Clostridia bacterium]|nr:PDZ domain-containing protein [Clostridia bacterium]